MNAAPYTLHTGDCRDLMATMGAESIDAIVTDPPYGLSFMGREWDHGVPGVPFWAEALRVAKPGAHLVAFGGSRTFHRLTCAIEDAGWEVRDCLMWIYGSGFPKSLDVSKAIDKAAGAEREDLGQHPNWREGKRTNGQSMGAVPNESRVTLPATAAARQWSGWGTALKPAYEPIILARKPLRGTVASNVQTFGTGALNVDGCRLSTDFHGDRTGEASASRRYADRGAVNIAATPGPRGGSPAGRFPANVLLDEEAAAVLDAQSGIQQGRGAYVQPRATTDAGGASWIKGDHTPFHIGDSGGASRFFYTAKASAEDRGRWQGNDHPTVKPTDLMRWLCRLVTAPAGLILDPFMGSGSTGCAAVAEGFRFVGIDLDQRHVDIAERRLAHAARQPSLL